MLKESDHLYDCVQRIRDTSGLLAKKDKLYACPELQTWLYHTYSPYRHYGVTPTINWVTAIGDEQLDNKDIKLLDALASRSLSGARAIRAVKERLNQLTGKSSLLLIHIINKDMRWGLQARSINQVFPGLIPVHAIQLAKPIDYARIKFPVLVSMKIDGLRAIFKDGHFYSRQGHQFQGLASLEATAKGYADALCARHQLTNAPVLDGELTVEGEHFNEISGQIRSFKETDRAVYNIFDMPSEGDRMLEDRLRLLEQSTTLSTRVSYLAHELEHDQDGLIKLYKIARDEGFEGLMVKDPLSRYENARTWAWQKIKNVSTVDCRVDSVFEGSGKYEGACGGLVVALPAHLCPALDTIRGEDGSYTPHISSPNRRAGFVFVGSGLTDNQRFSWWSSPDDIVGKTVEVAYQEVTPDGSLRHPRLICVRGDK